MWHTIWTKLRKDVTLQICSFLFNVTWKHSSISWRNCLRLRDTIWGVVRALNAWYLTVLNRTWLRLQKTEHKQRGTSCVITARRNGLPCTSDVLWTVEFWKLLNQNLTMQATESDERYPRSTIFNVLESQTESFVANVVQLLRNSPLSGKLYTLHDFSPL